MAERTDELTRDGDDSGSADSVDSLDESDVGAGGDSFDAGEFDGAVADLERDVGVDGRTGTRADAATDASGSRAGGLAARAESVFSPGSFLLQLGAALVGAFVVGGLVPLVPPAVAAFPGILLTTVVTGALSARPRYVEAALAGGASGALALFFGAITLSVVTGGMVPVVGAAAGALSAVVGFYAGRDLRDGVTKDL